MELRGATVLVTGGSSGIGRAIAKTLVDAGARVAITGRDEKRLAEAAQALKAMPVCGDVTNEADVRRTVEEVLRSFGHLDVLVNNAGKGIFKPLIDMQRSDFDAVLATNMTGAMLMAREAARHFITRNRGNIINIASLVAVIGQLHATTYVATKGAVTAFTKALAIDEAAHGVRVNAISPGNIYTPLWQQGMDDSPDPQKTLAEGKAAQLLGRLGTTEEAAKLCVFLAADATFTTGVDHYLTAGAELNYGRKTRI